MHVTAQIADAFVETLKIGVPALEQVYRYGTPPSGRRRFPVAVVMPGEATIDTTLSGGQRSKRVQTRRLQLDVAIRDRETAGADFAARLTDIAAAVEACMGGWSGLPIDDIVLTSDSGVQDLDEEGEPGKMAGFVLSFELTFLTVEGDSTAFILPNL